MYKVSYNRVPQYINELIPPMVGNRSQYQLRNSQNYENVQERTRLLQKSCIPSLVYLWNNLEIRNKKLYNIWFLNLKLSKINLKLSSMSKPDRILVSTLSEIDACLLFMLE